MEATNLTAAEKAALRKQRKAEKQNEKAGRKNKATTATVDTKPSFQNKGQGKRAKEIRLKSTFVNTTPKGEKKQFTEAMAAAYDPPAVEAAWYDWWEQQGFFKPSEQDSEKFVMVIPPPNVTGYLHMGHALTNAIQDSLTRWHRMSGRTTVWVPGTDHAGIATQTVVEKRIAKERGITRHDLGREAFVGEVYKWKDEYSAQIINQLKRIGSSLDWTREAFTMDNNFTKAVLTAFVKFYDDGLIYRENRLVNWSCTLRSTISDLEVDHITIEGKKKLKVPGYEKMIEFGELVKFAYKINGSEKGEDDEIIVATTRIETMIGDTAVAIHSKDPRYTHLHGKTVKHPFRNEDIPIICDDELVDMNFGTGAVKVTPAHDPNDYLSGKRNNLKFINILNDDGTFNENTGKFNKMKRYDVRYALLKELEDLKLLRGRESHSMVLAKCSRSNDIIEPVLKPQWWVNCESLAKTALEAVENGEIQLIPENPHKSTWKHYLSNIQPWCISRQLWWGHRIPAYRVTLLNSSAEPIPEEKSWVVAMSEEEAYKKASEKFPELKREEFELKQDEDVLDTWFSSGLFPIGVFGWPDNTVDLQKFYPTSLLETGRDILFFWVMRMVMMCSHFTGKLPFKQVFLHSMVRDAHGEKMSKAKGNVIDPIDVIEGITLDELHEKLTQGNLSESEIAQAKNGQSRDFPKGISECGTDAMRFALCSYTSQGTDINLDIAKVISIRNFCNKIWNAIKFGLGNLGEGYVPPATVQLSGNERKEELWILNKLAKVVKSAEEGWRSYDFFKITEAINTFWVDELCAFYLESTKVVFTGENEDLKNTTKATLFNCYEVGLRILHPFMPFVTEELWQRLPRRPSDKQSIVISPYPSTNDFNQFINEELDNETKLIEEIIHHIRSMRASYNIPQKTLTDTLIRVSDDKLKQSIQSFFPTIKCLAYANSLDFTEEPTRKGTSVKIITPQCSVLLKLEGIVDITAEIKKLENLLQGVEKSKEKLLATINNPLYSATPEAKQAEDKKKLNDMELKIETTKAALAGLQ